MALEIVFLTIGVLYLMANLIYRDKFDIGYFDVNCIIEPSEENWEIILRVTDDLSDFGCDFDDRYRGDCLRQELRKVFFNTVCIIENDYCINKTNHFKIVSSADVITEEEWNNSNYLSELKF